MNHEDVGTFIAQAKARAVEASWRCSRCDAPAQCIDDAGAYHCGGGGCRNGCWHTQNQCREAGASPERLAEDVLALCELVSRLAVAGGEAPTAPDGAPGSIETCCARCYDTTHGPLRSVMIVCPSCGNKRCPRATDHANVCSGSNEPGQPGSEHACGDMRQSSEVGDASHPAHVLPRIDLDQLDPGIRHTVAWLRAHGFNTTDSGDGKSKLDVGYDEALPYPHVFIRTSPEALIADADRLMNALDDVGIHVDAQGPEGDTTPCIQANYDPAIPSASIMLMWVDDEVFAAGVRRVS